MSRIFSTILHTELPQDLVCDPATRRSPPFEIGFRADGEIPFPQVIVWEGAQAHLFKGDAICLRSEGPLRSEGLRSEGLRSEGLRSEGLPQSEGPLRSEGAGPAECEFVVTVPAGCLGAGEFNVQFEGCRVADITRAGAGDWIKTFARLRVAAATVPRPVVLPTDAGVRIYFSIHKHMHQPYYVATNERHWDGEKDGIFGSRRGPYTHYVPTAVHQYSAAGLPHAGLSSSWSGSLIEQLDRCAAEGLCGGAFRNWREGLRSAAREMTALGHPRLDFTAFGMFHPLMPLIPSRDIVRSIELHRDIIRTAFDVEASPVLFPPETAFHVRMIPALVRAGVQAVIYDSIHRFRSCRDYPYAGPQEGMLPPNRADQRNPAVHDWLALHGIWAGSRISCSLLKPEWVEYEDVDGTVSRVVAVPAERYLGNEDARGGFGALQYPSVFGQVYDSIVESGSFDPKHPPFFVLHSDGDNHGGGADSYYGHNTGQLVRWLAEEPRVELTSIQDYLARFPPDPARAVHIEAGSWSGADNGDPQFMKWFSRYREAYSPDLNSWAVLTAFQNAVHSYEDQHPDTELRRDLTRLLLMAETSCYWYWTGQDVWDRQVTEAANLAASWLASDLPGVVAQDVTGPTVFPPWILPESPGGKTWGPGGLVDAPLQGTVHTFVHDVSGVARVTLVLRSSAGVQRLPMHCAGPYPSRTGARASASHYTATLPTGLGDVRYFVEAEDQRGNASTSSLEAVFLP